MSKYTTEVRYICEKEAGYNESKEYSSVDEIIQKAIPKVFSFNFPMFDEAYRNVLCTKILRHYYTREIGLETYGLWKLKLETKLNEIMPYYNQLYNSELLEFNPLYDTDLTTTNHGDKSGTENRNINRNGSDESTSVDTAVTTSESTGSSEADGTSTNNSVNRDLYSDTPQGALTGVENEEYLTNARKQLGSDTNVSHNENSTEANNETNYSDTVNKNGSYINAERHDNASTSTEDYLIHVVGKNGGVSYAKMLKEFRDTFLNIDMEVINDLSDLFFNLW